MKKFKSRQAWLVCMMLILNVFLITGCGSSDEAALIEAQFDSELPGIDTCTEAGPQVTFSDPANGDVNVPLNTTIMVTFDEAMDPTTIAYTDQGDPQVVTFTLYDNDRPGVLIPGTVAMSVSDMVATFTPTDDLEAGTTYTVTVTKYAKSAADSTPLGCNYRWEFQTVD